MRMLLPLAVLPLTAVDVAPIFSDHAVLQQGVPVPVWGTAAPGERVEVRFRGASAATLAGADGRWIVRLDPLRAQADEVGSDLEVVGAGRVVLRDVVVGEVWLGSGQSNMVWPLPRTTDGEATIAAADLPWLRLSSDTLWPSYRTPDGGWVRSTPETVRAFSAVLVHAALRLRAAKPVPIGLICRAVSGSAAGPWITRRGFEADAACQAQWKRYLEADYPGLLARHQEQVSRWQEQTAAAEARAAQRLATLEEGPHELQLRLAGGLPGLAPQDLVLLLRAEGAAFATAAKAWPADDRDRALAATVAARREATGVVADLAIDEPAAAGAPARALRYTLRWKRDGWNIAGDFAGSAGGAAVSGAIAGEVQRAKDERPPKQPAPPAGPDDPRVGEHHARFIAPVVPYAIRGFVWDQGESGTGMHGIALWTLMPALVAQWRQDWGQRQLPWIYVQKPSGGGWRWTPDARDAKGAPIPRPQPPRIDDGLLRAGFARLRFQQLAEAIPGSAMCASLDLDGGLHPSGKQAYGQRIADIALDVVYREPHAWRGPRLREHLAEGATLRLRFDDADGLRALGGEPVQGFMIAGADRAWRWAQARIDGDGVVLSHPEIAAPLAARYAWAEHPAWANLANGAGLPALACRTDDWPEPPAPEKKR